MMSPDPTQDNPTDSPSADGVDGIATERAILTGRRLVLAWAVSVAVHIGLFMAMFSVPWLVSKVPGLEELVVSETELVKELDAPRTTLDATGRDRVDTQQPQARQVRFSPRKFETAQAIGTPERRDLSIVGLGAGGGDFGKYGLGVGGDAGPQFFGLGGTARGAKRVVYVVHRSGSMLGTFQAVREELTRSVQRLRRSMRFHVIFFNAGPPLENPPQKMVHASRAEKDALAEFLGTVEPGGNTDPIPAMRRAFAVNPDVIYFLTDGEFDRELLTKLQKWNSKKCVRIFTIAYVSQSGAALLEQIAHEHNGKYRFVSEYDL